MEQVRHFRTFKLGKNNVLNAQKKNILAEGFSHSLGGINDCTFHRQSENKHKLYGQNSAYNKMFSLFLICLFVLFFVGPVST